MADIIKAVVLAGFGLAEGYTFARSGICDPQVFRDQFEFKSFLMMKIFLSAVGFSMLAQSVMSMFSPKRFELSRFYSYQKVSFTRAMLGCFILGTGMYIAGSGPTMAPSQLGSGMAAGPYIIAGMAIGAVLFSITESLGLVKRSIPACDSDATSLDAKMSVSYATLGVPLGAAMVGGALAFDAFFPHSGDVQRYNATSVVSAPLNPIFAGLAIGVNQVPLRFLTGDGQGGSTSVMNIVATLSMGVFSPRHAIRRVSDIFQFSYVYVGTGLGAYYAAQQYSGYKPAQGFSPYVTMAGAAVMLFGGRFAFGCTCGHGISGMSELSLSSIAAAMCIFGGGIAAGLINVFVL